MIQKSSIKVSIVCFIMILFGFFVANSYATADHELLIAKGLDNFNQGNFEKAIDYFDKALQLAPGNVEALYYSGVSYTRLGDMDKAEDIFLELIKSNRKFENSYLELGRIYYIEGKCQKSKKYLSDFISMTDDKFMKEYANELMGGCIKTEEIKQEKKAKKLNLFLSFGSQYDDNVILEAANPTEPAETKSDGRVVAYLIANVNLVTRGKVKVMADYNFYQSLHFDLDDFDVHFHKIRPFIEASLSEIMNVTLGYSYSYTLLGREKYSGINAFDGGINIKEGESLSSDLSVKYEDLKYWDSDLFEENSIRSGYQTTIEAAQNFSKDDKMSGKIYYAGTFNRADEDYWSYKGNKGGAELSFRLAEMLYMTVSGSYGENRYRDINPSFLEKRIDDIQQYSLIFAYKLSDRIALYISEDYTINDSNLADFDYKRNIIGFYLTISVL